MLVSGQRGIGKTALLSELEDISRSEGWLVLRANGRTGMAEQLVDTTIPVLLRELESAQKRRFTGVSFSGLGSFRTAVSDNPAAPEPVPTIETRLRELLQHCRESGAFIVIDELQDAQQHDRVTLAEAYQNLLKDDQPVALAMAGLSLGVKDLLDLPGSTFLRRARHYALGPLAADDAAQLIASTAQGSAANFSTEAVDIAAKLSLGYPYLAQLIGALSWDKAIENGVGVIDSDIVEEIRMEAISEFGTQVHQPSLRHLSPLQRQYLQHMAEIGGAAQSTREIAQRMNRSTSGVSRVRAALLDQDIIASAEFGYVRFTQPYMAEYLLDEAGPELVN